MRHLLQLEIIVMKPFYGKTRCSETQGIVAQPAVSQHCFGSDVSRVRFLVQEKCEYSVGAMIGLYTWWFNLSSPKRWMWPCVNLAVCPSDFYLCPALKVAFSGRHFQYTADMEQTVRQSLAPQDTKFYQSVFSNSLHFRGEIDYITNFIVFKRLTEFYM